MSQLLIELLSEEIPAKIQKKAEISYKNIFNNYFYSKNIRFSSLLVYVGPRRLVIYANEVVDIIPSRLIEIKGPSIDSEKKVIESFCYSYNVTVKNLIIKVIKNKQFYFLQKKILEQNTFKILKSTLAQPISEYVWPKSMRWKNYDIKWVRPLRNIMCLFNNQVIPFEYGHLTANNYSFGHKIMYPTKIIVSSFKHYKKILEDRYVIIDRHEREQYINLKIRQAANQLNLMLKNDQELLQEVAGLVEYPVILVGKIDSRFLSIPHEVIIAVMRDKQKYFCLCNKDSSLAPFFIFITNIVVDDYSRIIKDNEKVLSARLADALYFFNADIKIPLKNYLPLLDKVIFHDKLGSMKDKVERLAKICAGFFYDKQAAEAALLCKSDIISYIVNEFPSTQGIMGAYYAKIANESNNISLAIRDHYKPKGPNDIIPIGPAAILAIADKIDSLSGLIMIKETITSSKDPYAMRRQSLGIIRIIIENKININIVDLVKYACNLFSNKMIVLVDEVEQVVNFIEERLKYYFRSYYKLNLVNSVVDLKRDSNLLSINLKLSALKAFIESIAGKKLLLLYKRITNIFVNRRVKGNLNINLFSSQYEHNLFNNISIVEYKIDDLLSNNDYIQVLSLLAELQDPIDKLFNNVMLIVNDSLVTNNRLLLVNKVRELCNKIVKFDFL